jgi:hypothetical protein
MHTADRYVNVIQGWRLSLEKLQTLPLWFLIIFAWLAAAPVCAGESVVSKQSSALNLDQSQLDPEQVISYACSQPDYASLKRVGSEPDPLDAPWTITTWSEPESGAVITNRAMTGLEDITRMGGRVTRTESAETFTKRFQGKLQQPLTPQDMTNVFGNTSIETYGPQLKKAATTFLQYDPDGSIEAWMQLQFNGNTLSSVEWMCDPVPERVSDTIESGCTMPDVATLKKTGTVNEGYDIYYDWTDSTGKLLISSYTNTVHGSKIDPVGSISGRSETSDLFLTRFPQLQPSKKAVLEFFGVPDEVKTLNGLEYIIYYSDYDANYAVEFVLEPTGLKEVSWGCYTG